MATWLSYFRMKRGIMADYSEFAYRPPRKEWEDRYQSSNYNEAVCYSCGAIVNVSWGIVRHDKFHRDIEIGKN